MWVVYVWFCSFFVILPPPGCSCDDVGSAAACSLVDPRDLEGDGDERTEHNLGSRAVSLQRCSMKMASTTFVLYWIPFVGKSFGKF